MKDNVDEISNERYEDVNRTLAEKRRRIKQVLLFNSLKPVI